MAALEQQRIEESIRKKLVSTYGTTLEEASKAQIYNAVAMSIKDHIMSRWAAANVAVESQGKKKLYYLSVEFLMGRALYNNMVNMLRDEDYRQALDNMGIELEDICEQEKDPGLGNGGLGRLAACFLDSLATLSLPAVGCGIRYEYGLFRQKMVDGVQTELPDEWLMDGGNVWEVERPEDTMEVNFGGTIHEEWVDGRMHVYHEGYHTVLAVPYDMPIVGYDSPVVDTLKLWSARSPVRIDMDYFSRGEYTRAMEERALGEVISKVLYPADNHYEGKALRLKQHYFFSSATIQLIVKEHKRTYGNLHSLPEKVAIQVNDTHPALAMPELMRILMDEEGLGWDEAFDITRATFAYTNHTVMSEALEKWPVPLVRDLLPRIFSIINAMNEKYCQRLYALYPGQWEKISDMAIVANNEVRMANLCIIMGHAVNGVSQLHADILKRGIFRDFYVLEPAKFLGITNGITHRRWLIESNRDLTGLICEAIGDGWIKQPEKLEDLMAHIDDCAFLEKFDQVKKKNKLRLATWMQDRQGVSVDTQTLFDVQAKRLHEYKRQLLNILHVLYLYDRIRENPDIEMTPRTFFFGAKAWPGYTRAKLIIQLITTVGAMIDKDPLVKGRLKVVFLENYDVSSAQILIPAANVSEQLSTAGKEASGTGNMKFMMNGALTVGTMDGANVEIFEQVGEENIFIFGLQAEEVEDMLLHGSYHPGDIYAQNRELKQVLDQLIDGSLPLQFTDIFRSLIFGDGGQADLYFLLADFDDYVAAQQKVSAAYRDRGSWNRMAAINTAKSGVFSSDRTIAEYNDLVWHLKPLRM
ncbi:MAG: glycogen/starch/alpha-glucan phosphorylase [Christensenellales bacterium]|jgi:starch phosphorylase